MITVAVGYNLEYDVDDKDWYQEPVMKDTIEEEVSVQNNNTDIDSDTPPPHQKMMWDNPAMMKRFLLRVEKSREIYWSSSLFEMRGMFSDGNGLRMIQVPTKHVKSWADDIKSGFE